MTASDAAIETLIALKLYSCNGSFILSGIMLTTKKLTRQEESQYQGYEGLQGVHHLDTQAP